MYSYLFKLYKHNAYTIYTYGVNVVCVFKKRSYILVEHWGTSGEQNSYNVFAHNTSDKLKDIVSAKSCKKTARMREINERKQKKRFEYYRGVLH